MGKSAKRPSEREMEGHLVRTGRHAFELKIPPVVVAFVVALLMWWGSTALPSLAFIVPGHRMLAGAMALIGLAISISAVVSFWLARTTTNPTKPAKTSSLLVRGVYGFSRNPMYLGFLVVLLAWAIFLANMFAIALLPAFLIYMNRFQIIPEERVLEGLFSGEFLAYKMRVRRWL